LSAAKCGLFHKQNASSKERYQQKYLLAVGEQLDAILLPVLQ
jgi:hypothetical protein